jgi:hypothetical protein
MSAGVERYEVQDVGLSNFPVLWVWAATRSLVEGYGSPMSAESVAAATGWPVDLVTVLLNQGATMGLLTVEARAWRPGPFDPTTLTPENLRRWGLSEQAAGDAPDHPTPRPWFRQDYGDGTA